MRLQYILLVLCIQVITIFGTEETNVKETKVDTTDIPNACPSSTLLTQCEANVEELKSFQNSLNELYLTKVAEFDTEKEIQIQKYQDEIQAHTKTALELKKLTEEMDKKQLEMNQKMDETIAKYEQAQILATTQLSEEVTKASKLALEIENMKKELAKAKEGVKDAQDKVETSEKEEEKNAKEELQLKELEIQKLKTQLIEAEKKMKKRIKAALSDLNEEMQSLKDEMETQKSQMNEIADERKELIAQVRQLEGEKREMKTNHRAYLKYLAANEPKLELSYLLAKWYWDFHYEVVLRRDRFLSSDTYKSMVATAEVAQDQATTMYNTHLGPTLDPVIESTSKQVHPIMKKHVKPHWKKVQKKWNEVSTVVWENGSTHVQNGHAELRRILEQNEYVSPYTDWIIYSLAILLIACWIPLIIMLGTTIFNIIYLIFGLICCCWCCGLCGRKSVDARKKKHKKTKKSKGVNSDGSEDSDDLPGATVAAKELAKDNQASKAKTRGKKKAQ